MGLAGDGALQTVRPPFVLDVTRTLGRAGLGAATGIDRVERAWIDAALTGRFGAPFFLARAGGRLLTVDGAAMAALLPAVDGAEAPPARDWRARLSRARPETTALQAAFRRQAARFPAGAVCLNAGHANLTPETVAALRRMGARRVVVLLHDLIPLEYPQFARPDGPAKMRARLRAAEAADALIANSADTLARARARMTPPPLCVVAPLGVEVAPVRAAEHRGFAILGTIEPRKNHALLLDIWAGLEDPPPLHAIGRRGWMNAEVFARLDARPRGVIEHGPLGDAEARALVAGARALLFPSFAEGYGLPLAEALALGAPVVAADLPALREVGGDAPLWLSPEDAAGWRRAVLAFARPDSPERAARLAAAAGWRAPTWEDHFRRAEAALFPAI